MTACYCRELEKHSTWPKPDFKTTPYTKINSKWIKDLKGRTWNHKTPRRKQAVCSLTWILAIYFGDMSPQARETKAKVSNHFNLLKWVVNTLKKKKHKQTNGTTSKRGGRGITDDGPKAQTSSYKVKNK